MKTIFFTVLLFCAIQSCKKEEAGNAPSSIAGYWKGTSTDQKNTWKLSVLFKVDGSVRTYNFDRNSTAGYSDTALLASENKGDGTYTVKDKMINFNAVFPSGAFSSNTVLLLKGMINETATVITGDISYKGLITHTFSVAK